MEDELRNKEAPVKFFETPAPFARWLGRNHERASEIWVGYYKKGSGRASITWPESVREALRFGWIDGIRKSIDAESYKIRFTPRKHNSSWSHVNVQIVRELMKEGLMETAGLAAFEARSERRSGVYTYEQSGTSAQDEVEQSLRGNEGAWTFFRQQPPWYRRTCARWVMSAKRQETRERRLAILIDDSAAGRTIAPLTREKAGGSTTRSKKK